MYKVLIVDDDMLVRMELRTLIEWGSLGMELLEDANNGLDALQRIEQYSPDVIILDLGMPIMNGIEVLRELNSRSYCGKIIILTCHDDFTNVSEALKLGAVDYLLKHLIKAESLIAGLRKALEALEKENVSREENRKLKQISEMSLPVLRDELIKDIIKGSLKRSDILMDRMNEIGITMQFSRFIVALVEVDDLFSLKEKMVPLELDQLLKSIYRVIEEITRGAEMNILGCVAEGKYCIIVNFEKQLSFMNINSSVYRLCSAIVTSVRNYFNISVSVGISRISQDYECVSECYTQAELALEGKLYLGKNRIIHFSEIENYCNKLEGFFKDYDKEIISAVSSSDEEKLRLSIGNTFLQLKKKNIKIENVRTLSFELLSLSNQMIKESGMGYSEVFLKEDIPYEYVMNLETIDEIEEWFTGVCVRIHKGMNREYGSVKTVDCRSEIKKALEYIRANYMKDFTLQDISNHCNLSRTYFSQIFKQETGDNFIDYLMKYRIEKAKWMLKNMDLKAYEVGDRCGISNYRYFSRLFKEITGISPLDYRKSLVNDNHNS